ncbi:efflux transporter outer membrane subunit [Methylocapsa aurea]|uniref:efflux transporter outer membrane subunit n=1 Tax=Methylocapsa aurea TaxID=663610 RepID=UPI003D18A6AE
MLLAPLFFAGCNLAPDYAPPPVETPLKYKEDRSWVEARPRDTLPRGPWWRALGDHSLDELVPMVDAANPDLAVAVASLDQARAYSAKAASALLPHVDLNNSYTANKQSQHRPTRKANTPFSAAGYLNQLLDDRPLNEPDHYGNNLLTLQSSYEIDLWGRVRNAVALGVANSESAAAELESVRLSLQAELVRTYIALRSLDSERKLLEDTVRAYTRALELTKTLEVGNIGSPADQSRAQAQLESTRAKLMDVSARRAQLEHAIASLIGKPASSFAIAPASIAIFSPKIPPGAPLDLLERRPDIAAAERQVAAANAAIGVAKAAFFPRLVVNLSGGTQDTGLSLFNFRNSIWTLGPSITLPIFDAGARSADLAYADALYLKTAAHYRATVLKAYQEVEDALSSMHWLGKEQRSVEIAASAAENVLKISLTLYRDGATNYLDVVTAQTAALEAERTAITLKTRRLEANVALIVALGGGFAAEAPAAEAPTLTAAAAQGPSK